LRVNIKKKKLNSAHSQSDDAQGWRESSCASRVERRDNDDAGESGRAQRNYGPVLLCHSLDILHMRRFGSCFLAVVSDEMPKASPKYKTESKTEEKGIAYFTRIIIR